MTRIFGEVADMYDDVRPGYPEELAEAIRDYHGGVPASVVELAAGTGKGTEIVVRLGAPVVCVEPDPRMAAVLQSRFPQVTVEVDTFEGWAPTAGDVPLIACAMAWHWLDEATRNQRIRDVLTPGGTLAVFGHRYAYADPAQSDAIDHALYLIDTTMQQRPIGWPQGDIADSGCFTDIKAVLLNRPHPMSKERYLQLIQTFSPFRMRSPALQATALEALGALLDRFGGEIVLELQTTLILARSRPRRP